MVAAAAPSTEGRVRLQTEIRGAPARLWDGATGEIVIAGGAGTGKTRAILEWIHQRCGRETLRVLFLRKTLESLKTSALVTYQEQVLHGFDGKRAETDGVSYFGGNKILPAQFTYEETGSIIIVGGMDKSAKVLSTEYDIVYVNECTDLSLDDWEKITGRTDRPRLGPQRPPSVVIGDCNPDAPTHWIKLRAAEGKLQLWPSYHRDNPAMWDRRTGQWTEAGRRYLTERLGKLSGVRRKRYLFGQWVAAEGQVYDVWRDGVHLVKREVIEERLRSCWFFGTADWGWTKPGVLQVWAVDHDSRLLMVAEHYHTRRPVEGWWVPRAVELSRQYGVVHWACDPSEPQYIQLFRDAGLDAVGAVNDILPGITATEERLGAAGDGRVRLQIVEDCLLERDEQLVEDKLPWCTVQEIPEYVWPRNASGLITKDKPVDENNHGMDAMRYAVAELDLRGEAVLRPASEDLRRYFRGMPT